MQVSVDGVPWVISPGYIHISFFPPLDVGVDVGQGVDGVKDVDKRGAKDF